MLDLSDVSFLCECHYENERSQRDSLATRRIIHSLYQTTRDIGELCPVKFAFRRVLRVYTRNHDYFEKQRNESRNFSRS